MNMDKLIFAKGPYRLIRHLLFWLGWILFSGLVQLTGFKPGSIPLGDLALYQFLRSLTRIPSIIIFCYVVVYFLVPFYIPKRKYGSFLLSFVLFVFPLYWFNYFIQTPFYILPAKIVDNAESLNLVTISPFLRKFYSFYSNINFTGAIPTCCGMLAIKYYKDWYIKQSESELLIRENKQAELQLLKAQIHPHFLFNTLNNIYSFTLTGSPQAEGLVNKLSGMIDYITSEGEKTLVPLEKEIQFINDYIGLEKVRYGDRLNMQVAINGTHQNKMIAPLLMIPFVENCFKHGASIMRGQQWIKLDISIHHNQLDFTVSNSKPLQTTDANNKKGIGLANVQKRLQLIYPRKHNLIIADEPECFSVHLTIFLSDTKYNDGRNVNGEIKLLYEHA